MSQVDAIPARGVMPQGRVCVSCGYSLAGLMEGGRCPECGAVIAARSTRRYAENIADAPRWYLWTLAGGLALMLFGMIGALAGFVWWISLNMGWTTTPGGGWARAWWSLGWMAIGTAWGAGVWLTTWPRPMGVRIRRDPVLDSRWWRLVLCWGQGLVVPAWFALLGAALTAPVPGGGGGGGGLGGVVSQMLLWTSGGLFVAWLVVLAGVGVFLSALADWANDGERSELLRGSAIGIGAGTLVLLVVSVVFAGSVGVVALFQGLLAIGVVMSMFGLGVGVLSLMRTALWAIANSRSAQAKAERQAERDKKRADEMAARSSGTLAAPSAPVPVAHASPEGFGDEPVECSACGYDLRGLDDVGVCPECAVPYRISVGASRRRPLPDGSDEPEGDIPLMALDDAGGSVPVAARPSPGLPIEGGAAPAGGGRIRHRGASITMGRVRRMEGGPDAPAPRPLPEPASFDAGVRALRIEPARAAGGPGAGSVDEMLERLPESTPAAPDPARPAGPPALGNDAPC